MARELLDTFEAAKAAADAAAAGGGPADVDRCVDALRQLRRMPVSMQDLRETQVGRSLRCLKKHPDARIQIVASDLLEFWKTVVLEESSKSDKKNGISDDRSVSRVEAKTERTDHINVDKTPRARSLKGDSPKVEKVNLLQVPKLETIKVEKNGGSTIEKTREIQGMVTMEKQASMTRKPPSVPNGPPKLTSLVKCNDLLRDKLRELLAEAFSKVSDETSKDNRDEVRNILDEVDACDPLRIAVMVESVLFEKLGRSNGAQKVKIRSIMFNLRDGNNPDLRRRVLLGRVQPERLIEMSAEEMASDERKLSNKQIKEKALFECERGAAPKATTDQFKCGRCGQRKTTYYQLQTRSADEPMTTFVTCVNCNNHWKFC